MTSKEDEEFFFFLEIWQSTKKRIKLTLHFQEDDASIGLLRIDFEGPPHKNPEIINDHVPEIYKRYAGKWIENRHIHCFIEGYKPLAWAIPLIDDDFPIKEFTDQNLIAQILYAFGEKINLKTKLHITIQTQII